MFRRWVGPNAAGLALLGVVLVTEVMAQIWQYDAWRIIPLHYDGIPLPRRPLLSEHVSAFVLLAWFLAMPLGRLVEKDHNAAPRRQPAVVILAAAVLALLLALAMAIGAAWQFWGYLGSPPALDPRVGSAKSVLHLTRFESRPIGSRGPSLPFGPKRTIEGRTGRYLPTTWTTRGVAELARRGLLATTPPPIGPSEMDRLLLIAQATKLMPNDAIGGEAVEFVAADARRLSLISATGVYATDFGPLGRYPRYEFLLELPSSGSGSAHVISFVRYYENDNYAGIGWAAIFPLFGILLLLLFTAWAVVYLLLRRGLDRWMQQRQRGFAVEFVTQPTPRERAH